MTTIGPPAEALRRAAEALPRPAESFRGSAEALRRPAELLRSTAEPLRRAPEALRRPAEPLRRPPEALPCPAERLPRLPPRLRSAFLLLRGPSEPLRGPKTHRPYDFLSRGADLAGCSSEGRRRLRREVRRARSAALPEVPISTSIKETQVTFSVLFGKIIAAIAQYLTAAIVIRGKPFTPPALAAVFQAYLQAQADLDAARADVAAKKRARDAARAGAVAMLPSLRSYLAATYGEDSPVFTSFGFAPHKAAQKSTHVKAAAATKATATRKAHEAALAAADAPHAPGAPPAQPPAPAAAPPVKS